MEFGTKIISSSNIFEDNHGNPLSMEKIKAILQIAEMSFDEDEDKIFDFFKESTATGGSTLKPDTSQKYGTKELVQHKRKLNTIAQ